MPPNRCTEKMKQIPEKLLTTRVANWLRTITSDQTVYNNSSLSFWTRRYDITGDGNDWEVANSLFVLPILFQLNILETKKILQFRNEKRLSIFSMWKIFLASYEWLVTDKNIFFLNFLRSYICIYFYIYYIYCLYIIFIYIYIFFFIVLCSWLEKIGLNVIYLLFVLSGLYLKLRKCFGRKNSRRASFQRKRQTTENTKCFLLSYSLHFSFQSSASPPLNSFFFFLIFACNINKYIKRFDNNCLFQLMFNKIFMTTDY